jgi:uncharacterized membrane protein
LWLILLEIVVIRFSFFFNFYYDVTILQVIWVIGASMVVMSALIHFSDRIVLILGLIITFGHNLTDTIQLKPEDTSYPAWTILRQSGFVNLSADRGLLIFYPLLPWLGIMLLGYSLGKLYTSSFNSEKRKRLLIMLGISAITLFIIIRLINAYGDPAPWSLQKNGVFTLMSFINTTKYPPSVLYTLMTLGPVLIILAIMEKVNINALNPFIVFGRVPMFYYIFHFYLLHLVSLLLFMNKTDKSFSDLDLHFSSSFGGITPEGGYSLPWVYVAWISVVIFLYPFCKWYNNYKSTHRHWWLSYL